MLVCGGRWHDFDYARQQLLAELGAAAISTDYDCDLSGATALVTYTCDVRPTPTQQRALSDFVERGGRWFALHGTNAAIDPPPPGGPRIFRTPRALGLAEEVLGSRFLGHPPIAPYRVEITRPEHPLVAGIEPFEVSDEQYVLQVGADLEVLAHTDVTAGCHGFEEGGRGRQPVLYLRRRGLGAVCYCTLGHCRGRYDIADLGVPDTGRVDRGSWTVPAFRLIVRRAVAWAVDGTPDTY